MAAAGVKRAVGTSGDAVTRGRRPSAADLARCEPTVSPKPCYNIRPNISGVTGRTAVVHKHKPVLCRDCHASCPNNCIIAATLYVGDMYTNSIFCYTKTVKYKT